MFVDTLHSYYFEHPNEHVPGMMEIKALRQFAIAISHEYGTIPLSGYQIIISKLESVFHTFVELLYPITLQLEVPNLKVKHDHWAYAEMKLEVIQNNQVATSVYIEASCVDLNLFGRMRADKYRALEKYRFYPIHDNYRCFLRNVHSDTEIAVRICDLAVRGFLVEADIDDIGLINEDVTEFRLKLDDFREIRGHGSLVRESITETGLNAAFQFDPLSDEDSQTLKMIITKHFKVVENRFVF